MSRERHWTGDESRSHGRYSFLGIIGRVIVSDLAAFAHHRGYAGGCPLAMNSPSSRHTAATCGFGGRARHAFIGRHKREGHHLPYCAVVARAAPPDVTVDRTSHTSKSRAAHARPQDARAGASGNARRQSYPVISGGVIVSIVHTHHSYPGMPGRAIASLLAGHRRRCHRGNRPYTAL